MEILVTYDVSTETAKGRARLRRVAKICEAHGQRVQHSVFECSVSAVELEVFIYKLLVTINQKEDSLRIYRLREPRSDFVSIFGKHPEYDLHDPLIL